MGKRAAAAAILIVTTLVAGCSGDDETLFGPGNVSEDELRMLLPVGLIPAGFHEVAVDLDTDWRGPPPPGPTVIGRYEDGTDDVILISVTASGDSDLVGRYDLASVCADWEKLSDYPCPVDAVTPVAVGEDSRAIESTGSPDVLAHVYAFARDGITVGLTIQGPSPAPHALAPALLTAIDEAILELAEIKPTDQ